MAIEKVIQFECKVCGRRIKVPWTDDAYKGRIYCCGLRPTKKELIVPPAEASKETKKRPIKKEGREEENRVTKITRALSIRQPYAELIMRGQKDTEFRTVPTRIVGERVYIYASKQPADDPEAWAKVKAQPGELPTAVLIGTVIIGKCSDEPNDDGNYEWSLIEPERLPKNMKPKNRAQPVWFKPF